ncbi:MAG: class A beta-lactamase [Actinomycetota bacterium]|nr:class A beta-lactamase [Actinomycetota bacterium]
MSSLSRRGVLVGALSLTALGACAAPSLPGGPGPSEQPVPPTDARIEALEQRDGVVVGLHAVDLPSGRWLAHRAKDRFAMCSTFKGYAAAAVLHRADRGQLALADTVTIPPSELVTYSPVTEPVVGQPVTLSLLCQAAVRQSDNSAANALLRVLGGPAAITEFARLLGDEQSRLDRWETELNSAVPGDPRDTSTPLALGIGYRAVLAGDVLQPSSRQLLADWMLANQTSSMRAGLPGWSTADKTGSGGYGSTNDVGVAYGPDGQQLLLSIMTRSASDDPEAPNRRELIGELAAYAAGELYHR